MSKITLLEQMRMQRDQREGPEIKELKLQLEISYIKFFELERLLRQYEKAASQQIFKPMMDRIGCELADALLRELYEQVRKVAPAISKDYFFSLPPHVLMQLDSDSTFQRLLDQYKQQKYYPMVRFRGVKDGGSQGGTHRVMEINVKIPELNYRDVIEV